MDILSRFFAVSALLGLLIAVPSGDAYAADNNIRSLPGYKSYSTLSPFADHLKTDAVLYKALQENEAFAKRVLGSTSAQRQLLRDIERHGDSLKVIRTYTQALENGRDMGSVRIKITDPAPEKPEEEKADTRQERANLAAINALAQAQKEKELAQKRAKEALIAAQAKMDSDSKNALGEKALHEFERTKEMLAALDDHPDARIAFLADGALQQQIIDGVITLEDALAQLGVTPTDNGNGITAPAPPPIPHPMPHPSPSPEDGLVHVYGNKYEIDGKEIYDLNHVPSEEEMALDDNGWPKFLNVPDECGSANPDMTYFFENRYGYGKGKTPAAAGAMNMVATKGLLFHGGGFDIGLTDSEQLAAPFVTPNKVVRQGKGPIKYDIDLGLLPDNHSMVGSGFFNVSISHCPSDWENKAPEGQPELADACNFTYSEFVSQANRLKVKIQNTDETLGDIDPAFQDKIVCSLEPGKRYFLNLSPRHHVQKDMLTQKESKIKMYERLTSRYPEDYPLTPEAHFEAYLQNPGIGTRQGEFVATTGGYSYGRELVLHNFLPPLPNKAQRFSGDIGVPQVAKEGNYYAVSTSSMPRQPKESYQCTGHAGEIILDKTCKDPDGKLQPQRVVKKCLSESKSVWLEGYGERMFSAYVCEDTVQ